MPNRDPIAGIILAGGMSRRFGGGDKSLRELAGRTLLSHVVERVRPQVSTLLLNANGDPARFADFDLPVTADAVAGYVGPLAGVLTGLEWAREHVPGSAFVASFACDAPFMPLDLVARLAEAVTDEGADIACAASDGRDHPVFALWSVRLADDLRRALIEEDIRKVDVWTARYRLTRVTFSATPVDPFFNVNHPDDFATAEAIFATALDGGRQGGRG
jgi:molybdopterin-guanine dinucleotide biosynthesis protein A